MGVEKIKERVNKKPIHWIKKDARRVRKERKSANLALYIGVSRRKKVLFYFRLQYMEM